MSCCARIVVVVAALLAVAIAGAEIYPGTGCAFAVKAHGAKGDGIVKDTAAIQKAIDACASAGGGTVFFEPGVYLCGSIHLKSNVNLWLDRAATIMGSKDNDDYDPMEKLEFKNDADRETSFFHYALIGAEDQDHIGIVGSGTIDSNRESRVGPKAIALKRCQFVEIKGVTIKNIPNYPISMLGTDCVNIDGVTILNGYADGIDPDACRNVRIANCHIESVDDAIVPKASFSLGERRSTENITVTNCYLSTACNAFKLGTESGGDFKRIAVSNCVMTGLPSRRPASSGIAIESVDGANIDGVVVSNITMVDVRAPIFIRLGNRGRDMETPVAGSLKNVSISNIVATNASLNCSITGVPGARVEGVTVSGVRIAFWGGGPFRAIDAAVPENIKRYPDADMFDGLPGYGFYCRHAHGLSLSDINLTYGEGFWRLDDEKDSKTNWRKPGGLPEPSSPGRPGPAVVCEDVDGIKISGLAARPSADDPVIVFRDVRNALVTQCMLAEKAVAFLDVAGKQSDAIHMAGNLISGAGKTFTVGSGARKKCVSESGDLVK